MIERIVDFSVKNRVAVVLAVLCVAAAGVRAARSLPIDAVPDVTNVQVQVLTNAPALGPLEVEQLITFPVESVMSGLPKLAELRSTSRFGVSAVTLVFEDGTDLYFARQLVQERLAQAQAAISPEHGSPQLGPISSGLGEIYQFEVRGEPMCEGPDTEGCYTPMELRSLLDWSVAYPLRSVPGVVEVNSFGGELKTYEVSLDPGRLRAFALGVNDVLDALKRNNANAGGGYIAHAGEQRLVRAQARITSLDDIRRIVLSTRAQGTPVRIADVAEVRHAPLIRQGAVTRDGRGEAVTGVVMMLVGANSREVARAVDARIEGLRASLPAGVTLETFYDRTELVDRTIRTVTVNLLEGGLLVVAVLLLLLGNLRGGLLVASVIPLSMLATFIAMRALGVSGNLMSLGALDFGLLVDGAVVIVDAVVIYGAARAGSADGVSRAARSVARPVLFAVAIIVCVYLPVLSLEGIEGRMFRPMAWTVIFALLASAVLAITWVPALSAWLFSAPQADSETRFMRMVRAGYEPVLDRVLTRPAVAWIVAGLALLTTAAVVPMLGARFTPRLDEGAIAVQAVRLSSVSLEESIASTTRTESVLLERFGDEIRTIVSKTGRAEIATDPMGVDLSDIYVMLNPPEQWTHASGKQDLVAQMKRVLEREVPGQAYMFSQPIELRTNELISGSRADIAAHLYGDDLSRLQELGAKVASVLAKVEGARDVGAQQLSSLPFVNVVVDRDALARYGVDARAVLDTVGAMAGVQVGEVFEGQRRFVLQVRVNERNRGRVDAVRRLPVRTPRHGSMPLGQLARIERVQGPAQVQRAGVQRRYTVQVNVADSDVAGFIGRARRAVRAQVEWPEGYRLEWGGQFENLERASERLAWVVPSALAGIFILLYLTYGAGRPAGLVFLNVPFAATGGVFALWARGMPLSISAGIGFIALFGIAVLNGVVLVSAVRDRQAEGEPLGKATTWAARTRLRPVLMTALTDALGFAPMALSTAAGAEVQRPLATVVIGGLFTCTLLTLFVLPSLYMRFGGDIVPQEGRE